MSDVYAAAGGLDALQVPCSSAGSQSGTAQTDSAACQTVRQIVLPDTRHVQALVNSTLACLTPGHLGHVMLALGASNLQPVERQ